MIMTYVSGIITKRQKQLTNYMKNLIS